LIYFGEDGGYQVLRVIQWQILKPEDRPNPQLWTRRNAGTNGMKKEKKTIYCLEMTADFISLTVWVARHEANT